jgi:hypothetical protein
VRSGQDRQVQSSRSECLEAVVRCQSSVSSQKSLEKVILRTIETITLLEQLAKDTNQIATNSAANTAVIHLKDLLLGGELVLDQSIIDANFAKFVLDDSDALAVILSQDIVQQCCLAASKKPWEPEMEIFSVRYR